MTKRLFKALPFIVASILGINILTSIPTSATSNNICNLSNVSDEVKAAAGCPNQSTGTLDNALTVILNGIILIMGIVAVVFIIIGGVNYMTSSGDANKTKKAKDTILYAVIGLIICALAFAIVNFVIGDILKQNPSDHTPTTTQQNKQDQNKQEENEEEENEEEENEEESSRTNLYKQNNIAFFKK